MTSSTKKIIAILVAIVVVVSICIAAVFMHPAMSDKAAENQTHSSKTEDSASVNQDNIDKAADLTDPKTIEFIKQLGQHEENYPTTYGKADAPLTVIEFSDYSCPMCAKLHNESYKYLNKLADEGKLRLKYIPYVTFKSYGSDIAAAGAIAAGKQGKFREYNDLVYSKSNGHPEYTKEKVIALAKEAGITDLNSFEKDLNDQKIYQQLDEDVLKISSWGISGTPALIVGNAMIPGAYPESYVRATIDDQLAKAKSRNE